MAEYPALPLWTDAYLGDTTHLTTIEHGAYFLLLMAMWRTPDCSLPNDDRLLARYAKLTKGQWARIKPVLMPFFRENGGRITQGRLTDERDAVRQKSKRQSDKSKARWLKEKETDHAAAIPDECQGDPSLTLTHVEPNGSTDNSQNAPDRFLEFWEAYGHKKGKGQARPAWKRALKKADPDTIINAALLYAQTRDPSFVKNASTWLNGECWDDDPQTNVPKQMKGECNGSRPQPGIDPGYRARTAFWDELDAEEARANADAGRGFGYDDGDAGDAGERRSQAERMDRAQGRGAVVPFLPARFG